MINLSDWEIQIIRAGENLQINFLQEMDSITEGNIQLRPIYLQILAQNLDNDFEGYYAAATYNDKVVAWTYFFIDEAFSFKGIVFGRLEKIHELFPIKFKTAFVSSPVSEYNKFHIAAEYEEYENEIVDRMIGEIVKFSRKKKAKMMIVKDHQHNYAADILRNRFSHFYYMPGTVVDLEYESFDEYLNGLNRKRRYNIRSRINKKKPELLLEVVAADSLTPEQNARCHELYAQTRNKQSIKHEYLASAYFGACAEALQDHCQMLLARVGEKIIGFAQLFVNDDDVTNVRMGMDYAYSTEYQTYFHLFYENIRFCIANHKRKLFLSQTCYGPKLELGAKIVPLHSFIRVYNPLIHFIFGKAVVANFRRYEELALSGNPSEILAKYDL